MHDDDIGLTLSSMMVFFLILKQMKVFLYFVICKQSLRAQHSIYCNNQTIVYKLINHVRFLRTNREKKIQNS